MEKCWHFRGTWKNGDNLVIASYGKSKKDAYIKILQARKENKFMYKYGDNFNVTYETNEDCYNELICRGYSRNEANILSVYGHTTYIVKDGKVTIN